MTNTFLILFGGMLLGGVVCAGGMVLAWKKKRFMSGLVFLLMTIIMFLSASIVLLVGAGIKGYKAFTREEPAATVAVTPFGAQQFNARVMLPDGRDTTFAIAGDELYMDARVLKWKPFVNFLGLHTAYRLDRVAGRYVSLRDEKAKTRTTYSLSGDMMPWDLFFLRVRYRFLAPVLDAEYGSAVFVPVSGAARVRVTVSTSGLVARTD